MSANQNAVDTQDIALTNNSSSMLNAVNGKNAASHATRAKLHNSQMRRIWEAGDRLYCRLSLVSSAMPRLESDRRETDIIDLNIALERDSPTQGSNSVASAKRFELGSVNCGDNSLKGTPATPPDWMVANVLPPLLSMHTPPTLPKARKSSTWDVNAWSNLVASSTMLVHFSSYRTARDSVAMLSTAASDMSVSSSPQSTGGRGGDGMAYAM
mmetsp:Transcript_73227/g.212059  ORF Transcript_73227/g.212059 Transcript_73227/m.212059 type:complete len:212 (+) Transcript_73227:375-1010(+)